MRKYFQNVTLKQWHRALLRLTLPIVWVFLLICLCFTLALLGVPCIIAAFVSWVICRNPHPEYTIVWCAFPLFALDLYRNWLKENGVIE